MEGEVVVDALILSCSTGGGHDAAARAIQEVYANHGKHTVMMNPYNLRACDIYLTKPGGLSTTEAAVMGKPLVHLPPIPGCETRNAAFFSTNGMSMKTGKGAQALDEVFMLLEAIPRQERMIYCQQKMIPQDAAEAIFDLASQISQQSGSRRL